MQQLKLVEIPTIKEPIQESLYDHTWLRQVYGEKNCTMSSRYATDLYQRNCANAEAGGWLGKLRYLLYKLDITKADAASFSGLHGVLLQSKPGENCRSQNPFYCQAPAQGALESYLFDGGTVQMLTTTLCSAAGVDAGSLT